MEKIYVTMQTILLTIKATMTQNEDWQNNLYMSAMLCMQHKNSQQIFKLPEQQKSHHMMSSTNKSATCRRIIRPQDVQS